MAYRFGRVGLVVGALCVAACGGPVNAFNDGPLEDGATETQAGSDSAHVIASDAGNGSFDVVGLREVPLVDARIAAFWMAVNDCGGHPQNCTTGATEPTRSFDGTPFCTKGTTAIYDGMNFGAVITLEFLPSTLNAAAAGILGFSFDITGTSPAAIWVDVHSPNVDPDTLAIGSAGTAPVGRRSFVRLDQLNPVPPEAPVDPTKLSFLSFLAFAGPAPIPFDYCIANVAAVQP